MRDHATIVRESGSADEVALKRGVSVHTVRSWINRNRIPAEQWAGFALHGWATLEELANTVPGKAAA